MYFTYFTLYNDINIYVYVRYIYIETANRQFLVEQNIYQLHSDDNFID